MTGKKKQNPFGPVWGASGVQGFFGEGYAPHRMLRVVFPGGFNFGGMCFVAKTGTIPPRGGNMPLRRNFMPEEFSPRCVYVDWLKGIALNAVGLSNPGLEALFGNQERCWQGRLDPFQISFMPLETTPEAKLKEWEMFLGLLDKHLKDFRASHIGVQSNKSCPNVGADHSQTKMMIDEIRAELDLTRDINKRVKFIFKFSATFPPEEARHIADHPACWGIVCSNTIPWRAELPWLLKKHQIDWDGLFGEGAESPLIRRGFRQPGGLSGKPLMPIVCNWIERARRAGVSCHLNGGGGILHPRDVDRVFDAGADSVSLGSVAFLRPWRVQSCIRRAWRRI